MGFNVEMGQVELRVLGQPEVRLAGESLSLPPKRLALVTYLAVEGSARPLHRAHLADLFWSDGTDEGARRNLRQELHRLKGSPLAPFLVLEGEVVGLRSLSCDALTFETQAHTLDAADLLAIYRGPLLNGVEVPHAPAFEEWLTSRRERLNARWLELCRARAHQLEQQGDPRGAIEALTPLRAAADEAACLSTMRLHVGLGELQAAGQVYAEICRLLADLGLSPALELTVLAERLRGVLHPPAPPAARQRASLDRPPLIGRDGLLARLEEQIRAGERLVLLEGEPGAGKSALAQALATRWGHALKLQGYEETGNTPFLPLAEALRPRADALRALPDVWRAEVARLLPEWAQGAGIPPTADTHGEGRARFLEGLARAVKAASAGGLLWLDDLHWFDPSTLEVLGLLLRGGEWRAVGTVRTLERRQNAALERLLLALERRRHLCSVEVGPLSETDTLRLLRALSPSGMGGTRFARRLHEGTQGNPLFLLEMLRTLLATGQLRESGGEWHTDFDADTDDYHELPLPSSVAGAVLSRVTRLSPGGPLAQVLAAAALLGDGFSLEELTGSLPLDEWALLDLLDQAVDAGLLGHLQDGRYGFAHSLIQRTLLEHLSADRRRLLHRRLAANLSHLGTSAARLAAHLEGGGDWEGAARNWLLAARDAARMYAHREALQSLERALTLGLPPELALEAEWQRVTAFRALDDRPGWRAALEAVTARLSPTAPPRLILHRLELEFSEGEYSAVLAGVHALRAGQSLSAEEQGWAGLWQANALNRLDRWPEAMVTYASTLSAAPATSLELRGRLLNGWAYAASQVGDLDLGQAKVEEAQALFSACGHRKGLAMAHNTAGTLLYMAEHDEAAAQQYRLAHTLAVEIGDRTSERLALTSLSAIYLVLEDFEAALEVTNSALELLEEWPDPYTECLMYERLSLVHRARGQRERQRVSLRQWRDRADKYHYATWSVSSRLSLLEALLDDPAGQAECRELLACLPTLLAACPEAQQQKQQARLEALTENFHRLAGP